MLNAPHCTALVSRLWSVQHEAFGAGSLSRPPPTPCPHPVSFPLQARTTAAVTGLQAYVGDNVLPPSATINVNFR